MTRLTKKKKMKEDFVLISIPLFQETIFLGLCFITFFGEMNFLCYRMFSKFFFVFFVKNEQKEEKKGFTIFYNNFIIKYNKN